MGTQDYLSPGGWRGAPASRAADIYSLGALLFELSAGRPPRADRPAHELAHRAQHEPVLPLAQVAADVDPRFAAIVDRCLRLDPSERFPSADALRDALEALWRRRGGSPVPAGNPYRGLLPFEAAHRAFFFGRESDISSIVDKLRSEPLVVIAGDSGIGKSSVCRAGVLPAIVEGNLGDHRNWAYLTMTPGPTPLRTLAVVLAPLVGAGEADTRRWLHEDLGELLARLRRRLGDRDGAILFIDQLEELTTQSAPEEVADLERLLVRLTQGVPGLRALATVRADFLTRVASLPEAGGALAAAVHILQPLSPARIRQVILGPAELTGTNFESEALVEQLVATTAGARGGLPLLQFALAELWEARDKKTNQINSRTLAEIGDVSGALARHADSVLDQLRPTQKKAARRALTQLVGLDQARVRRRRSELGPDEPALREALEGLVRGRILVTEEADESPAYELAHEVLIGGWRTLAGWLAEDAEAREVRERLRKATTEWDRLGRGRDGLWGTRQIAEVRRLGLVELPKDEQTFVERSQLKADRSRRTRSWLAVAFVSCGTIQMV